MKLTTLLLLATSLILSACNLPQDQKDKLASNLAKDGQAALVGGLTTGSWEGAAAGALGQAVKNNLTAPKNPVKPVTPQ